MCITEFCLQFGENPSPKKNMKVNFFQKEKANSNNPWNYFYPIQEEKNSKFTHSNPFETLKQTEKKINYLRKREQWRESFRRFEIYNQIWMRNEIIKAETRFNFNVRCLLFFVLYYLFLLFLSFSVKIYEKLRWKKR